MNAFLSVKESLKYWRSDVPYYQNELGVAPAYDVAFCDCASSVRDMVQCGAILLDGNDSIEVLVSSRSNLRYNERLSTRLITTPLPRGSFFEIGRGTYVCSPELTFLLASTMVPLRSLIALGCELCGTYSLFGEGSAAIKHAQITDVATIREYLKKVPGMHGVKRAKQALGCMADGSASARETDLYMQYCMRPKYGSFGLGGVELNHTFDLDDHPQAKALTRLKKITPDLYWPKHKIAVEYESTEHHGAYVSVRELLSINRRKLSSDSERRRTYDAMGIFVLTVTDGEFCNYDEVDRIAKLLARHMKKYNIKDDLSSQFCRSELHEWLKIPAEKRGDIL